MDMNDHYWYWPWSPGRGTEETLNSCWLTLWKEVLNIWHLNSILISFVSNRMIIGPWTGLCSMELSQQSMISLPKSHKLTEHSPHCRLHLSVPECVNDWIQERSENCIKDGQKLIQEYRGRWPRVEKYQRTKEQDYYSDVSWKCGQSLRWTTWRVFLNSENDDNVGNDQNEDGANRDEPTVGHDHEL